MVSSKGLVINNGKGGGGGGGGYTNGKSGVGEGMEESSTATKRVGAETVLAILYRGDKRF